jgi:hypothetical protein
MRDSAAAIETSGNLFRGLDPSGSVRDVIIVGDEHRSMITDLFIIEFRYKTAPRNLRLPLSKKWSPESRVLGQSDFDGKWLTRGQSEAREVVARLRVRLLVLAGR